MRGKKWLLTVVCALLLVGVVCILSNWLIDPFGVFEASPLQWDSYAQTLNPRGSKVRYISERPGEYDSFVVGSSSAASYLPETLERYYGGSFYNMFHYGADTDYDRELVRYLLEQKMPWEIESRLWEIAGEKRDVEDIIFIYQRDAETMAECVRRYEARYACFGQEFTKLSQRN